MAASEFERDLQQLAGELKRLEADFSSYFAGRVPRPPLEARSRVEALLKRLDRSRFDQVVQRFRFQTLQARYATFSELWDRNLRLREEGRTTRVPPRDARDAVAVPAPERLIHVAEIADPGQLDRVEELYTALMDARRDAGEQAIPFHRFAQVVRDQLRQFQEEGAGEVRFRVTERDGRIRLTARARKPMAG